MAVDKSGDICPYKKFFRFLLIYTEMNAISGKEIKPLFLLFFFEISA